MQGRVDIGHLSNGEDTDRRRATSSVPVAEEAVEAAGVPTGVRPFELVGTPRRE